MRTIELLEELAVHVSHHSHVEGLMNGQSVELRQAFIMNNAEYIKMQFIDIGCLADEVAVVQI